MRNAQRGLTTTLGKDEIEVEIGGEKMILSPLTLGDMGEYRAWVRKRSVAEFIGAAKDARLDPLSIAETVKALMSNRPSVTATTTSTREMPPWPSLRARVKVSVWSAAPAPSAAAVWRALLVGV